LAEIASRSRPELVTGDTAPVVEGKNPLEPDAAAKAALVEQNRKAIKKDVETLYDLAAQLKTDVERTDSTAVLSLALVKKAEKIDKLAKHIKGSYQELP
jgi:hypothetical protein